MPTTYMTWNELVRACDVADVETLRNYTKSRHFMQPFQALAAYFVRDETAREAAGNTRPRPRVESLQAVRDRSYEGEASGRRMFSDVGRDRSTWTSLDHHASFLHWARVFAVEDRDGIFFNRVMSTTDNALACDSLLWELLKRLKYDILESRSANSVGGRMFRVWQENFPLGKFLDISGSVPKLIISIRNQSIVSATS